MTGRKRSMEEVPGSSRNTRTAVENDEDDEDFQDQPSTSRRGPRLIQSDDEEDDDLENLDESNITWKCDLCRGKLFKNANSLKQHQRRSHSGPRETFICPTCSKQLSSKSILKRHESTHEKGTFPCDECTFVGRHLEALTSHKNMDHRVSELSFKCTRCDSAYASPHQLKNHENAVKHPELYRFEASEGSNMLVDTQGTTSQPLSVVSAEEGETSTYDFAALNTTIEKDSVAVLVMNIWGADLKQMKSAMTVKFKTAGFKYAQLKSYNNGACGKTNFHNLTDDHASFYVTGPDAENIANTCLGVIKITQLLLDVIFKFNQFTKLNQLGIKNWNWDFFQKFLASNGLTLIFESKPEYVQRRGEEEEASFSMYYRSRDWISKNPEPHVGHIYAAYFKFLGDLYIYIGLNDSIHADTDILPSCHFPPENDRTALGLFVNQYKDTHPGAIVVQAKRLLLCARSSTQRHLESVAILAALFGSEEEIFLDNGHKGKFKLLNKRVELEEFTPHYLHAMRYIAFLLFKKRMNFRHEGDYTAHVNTTVVDECYQNVTRMNVTN